MIWGKCFTDATVAEMAVNAEQVAPPCYADGLTLGDFIDFRSVEVEVCGVSASGGAFADNRGVAGMFGTGP